MKVTRIAIIFLFLTGCASAEPNRVAFTESQQIASQPYGFSNVRLSPQDTGLADRLEKDVREGLKQHPQNEVSILALSGGGADGSFGAGVLTGWTQRGDRPDFTIVTGVSTGALIAPFAFLGPSYDAQLKEAYTSGITSKLLKRKGLSALFSPGVFSSDRLEGVVDHFVDVAMVEAIARENDKGRRLEVATTNLDTQSGVIWDIGAIASQGVAGGTPVAKTEARDLIRKVLVASASVPGAFAPVMIQAKFDAAGTTHWISEMHVDGGVTLPFFILPDSMLNWKVPQDIAVRGHVYVLINGNIDYNFIVTPYTALGVAGRSLDTMTRAQARSTLHGIQAFACRNGFEVSVASIPNDFKSGGLLAFDKRGMQLVFDKGLSLQEGGQAFKNQEICGPP